MNKSPKLPSRPSIAEVAASECIRCADDPNVACVGFGLKFTDGNPKMEAALHFFVYEKLSSDDDIKSAGSQIIPDKIEGYQTDVRPYVAAKSTACPGSNSPTGDRGSRIENPLVGGSSTTVLGDWTSIPTGYGTLGGLCFDADTGDAMALSNAHVYGFDLGNDAIQPWLPTSEFLEASAKYLFCGGPLAHLFFWTAPSPLTAILTTAAAGAFIAAAASDAEDPPRWGQRTGAVPAAGVLTEREVVRLSAEPPHLPFPGRAWKTDTTWDYTRVTTSGSSSTATSEPRENEHVLVGKRVFTDRLSYQPGSRVRICAELVTPANNMTADRFVVAHCTPFDDPTRVVRRVLAPSDGGCRRLDQKLHQKPDARRVCVRGFTAQLEGSSQMLFQIKEGPFILWSRASGTTLYPATNAANPTGLDAVRLPRSEATYLVVPPSTNIDLLTFQFNAPIRARAFAANGTVVDDQTTPAQQGAPHTLTLRGLEIVVIELSGGNGEGFLAAICADNRPAPQQDKKVRSRYYTGTLDLPLNEPAGDWGVLVTSQTIDMTENGGDPIDAARRLGGIVDSANIVEEGECRCTVLFDTTFSVV
ncbi:MAG: hypothetical protein AAF769_04010 [Pseudomonadota bacterium]